MQFLPFMLIFVSLVYYGALKITQSPFGRILKGIREDEKSVISLGKDVKKFKIIIFMVGTGIAAGVGGIFAHYSRFINPSIGTLDESILIIAMVVLGGIANLWGSAIGAFLLITIPEALNFSARGKRPHRPSARCHLRRSADCVYAVQTRGDST